jgi:hypothetical protein
LPPERVRAHQPRRRENGAIPLDGRRTDNAEDRHIQITDILAQAGGLKSMARELGISESQAASGATALLPAVLGGFKKQAQAQPGGVAGLGGLINRLGGSALLENVLAAQPTDVSRGSNVLGQIFGSKDVSRAVAENAASQSGLTPDVLKKMLPMLAMAVTGVMANQGTAAGVQAPSPAGAGGGLGGVLGKLFGGGGAQAGGGIGAAVSGLASMLDMNKDGNPLDDILQMVGKGTR